ncbi:MAG: metallophosphoesterase family protein [Phycisphaerales bacterium]|nr:metallophosphoesterase family protein [Phycisphaerales bacterium]
MPRIALISDIHGNLEALDAVLKDIAQDHVDRVCCLGDIVGYGPDPGQCIEVVFTVCDKMVLGNHEEALLRSGVLNSFNPRARQAIDITRQLLSDDHMAMLESIPDVAKIDELTLAHASFGPVQYEYLATEEAVDRSFEGLRTKYGAVGHTHIPGVFSREMSILGGSSEPIFEIMLGSTSVPIRPNTRAIMNPGSVGQPRDRNPDASWGIFDTDDMRFEIRRVAYDVDATQAKIARLGMPSFHGERLKMGA